MQSSLHTSSRLRRHTALRVLAGVAVLVVVSGCASRKTKAPVVNRNTSQAVVNAQAKTTPAVPTTPPISRATPPTPTIPAPQTARAAQNTAAISADTYIVKAGDTLYSLSRSFGVSLDELVRLNDLVDPAHLWAGQELRLRGKSSQASANRAPATPSARPAARPAQAAVSPTPRPAQTTPPASSLSWGWPAQGNIIRSFNTNTKGIDIAGKVGDPVRAAAAGTVRYVGNGVRGLGNLVLIEHGADFLSVYAHNQQLLVKEAQKVKKGERIALLGQSDTTSPRLHFEIRRKGTPINPINHLPKK